jgi:hypothetical protein
MIQKTSEVTLTSEVFKQTSGLKFRFWHLDHPGA